MDDKVDHWFHFKPKYYNFAYSFVKPSSEPFRIYFSQVRQLIPRKFLSLSTQVKWEFLLQILHCVKLSSVELISLRHKMHSLS